MKRKSIKEMLKEINNIREEVKKEDLSKCITGNEFESWLKDKKKDCENI